MQETVVSLLFLLRGDEVLLAMKKRGFGEGRWNGVGGKLNPGETLEQAMIRETQEEIGVTPTKYEKVGDIRFDEFFKGQPAMMHVHVFTATEWGGEPAESEEMAPRWFKKTDVPYGNMWSDDPYWLPQVLDGKKISADFKLDETDDILEHTTEEVAGF